jgi:regulator of protease activity HflC (stomatin/prohibitin superfamily)
MRILGALVSIAVAGSLTSCAVIEPGQRGVKVSLGQMDRNLLNNGMQFYNPLTDQINQYSVKQDTKDGQADPLTADQQPISISYKVLYKIPEGQVLTLYEKYAGDPFERLVAPQVQEAFRQVVSQYKADAATRNVNVIKNQVVAMVRSNVNGLVDVVDIPITHVGLPEVLQTAIAAKQVMEQQALQKSYELDKARKEAEITIANAQAQAKSIELQSLALQKSPTLIEWERVKKWDGVLPNTMMVTGNGAGGFSTMLNLGTASRETSKKKD